MTSFPNLIKRFWLYLFILSSSKINVCKEEFFGFIRIIFPSLWEKGDNSFFFQKKTRFRVRDLRHIAWKMLLWHSIIWKYINSEFSIIIQDPTWFFDSFPNCLLANFSHYLSFEQTIWCELLLSQVVQSNA